MTKPLTSLTSVAANFFFASRKAGVAKHSRGPVNMERLFKALLLACPIAGVMSIGSIYDIANYYSVAVDRPPLVAFISSRFTRRNVEIRKLACWGLGLAFIYFSMGHVVQTNGMVEMLPQWVPMRLPLVYVTGVLEVAIAIALFIPAYQSIASKLAIVVFVAFFPANIYAALNGVGLGGHQWGPVYLLIRGPLQIVLIAWAYWLCLGPHNKSAPAHG